MLSIVAICTGASIGALARWSLGLWLNHPSATLPWGTLAANLVGGYLVGIAVAVFQGMPELDPAWRLAIVAGFLGGLTTFSSFSAEVVGMLQRQDYALALGTAALHVLGSLVLTVLGIKTTMLLVGNPHMKIVAWVAGGLLVLLLVAVVWAWTPDRSRAELESKYLRAPADLIDLKAVPGVRLHVRDSGPHDAPAVLLLHGFGASLQTWDAWATGLEKDFRVIRLDLPGNGLSAPDPRGDYTDARSMQILLALLDQLGVARASVVGNSIGGRIAWTLAAAHPERVARLVLVSPDGFASPGFEYGKAPAVPASIGLMRYFLPKAVLRMSLEPAYANPAVMTDALATRYFDLMLGPGSRDAMINRMKQTVLTDPVPLLKRITAPTLLLWGRQDGMIPFGNSADYQRALPNSKLVALDGVGHLPQEEAPERSLAALREFLQSP